METVESPTFESVTVELGTIVSRINQHRFRINSKTTPQGERILLQRKLDELLGLRTYLKRWLIMKYQHDSFTATKILSTSTGSSTSPIREPPGLSGASRSPLSQQEPSKNSATPTSAPVEKPLVMAV